jgi:hypothetical protein
MAAQASYRQPVPLYIGRGSIIFVASLRGLRQPYWLDRIDWVFRHDPIPALFLRKSSPKSVFNCIHMGKWSDIW